MHKDSLLSLVVIVCSLSFLLSIVELFFWPCDEYQTSIFKFSIITSITITKLTKVLHKLLKYSQRDSLNVIFAAQFHFEQIENWNNIQPRFSFRSSLSRGHVQTEVKYFCSSFSLLTSSGQRGKINERSQISWFWCSKLSSKC